VFRRRLSTLSLRKSGPRPLEKVALSLGERVDRDGAFISRRGPGEGLFNLGNLTVP